MFNDFFLFIFLSCVIDFLIYGQYLKKSNFKFFFVPLRSGLRIHVPLRNVHVRASFVVNVILVVIILIYCLFCFPIVYLIY